MSVDCIWCAVMLELRSIQAVSKVGFHCKTGEKITANPTLSKNQSMLLISANDIFVFFIIASVKVINYGI